MNGLPLLSHPPPEQSGADDSACRKCNKEFNFLFSRQRRCNHCGYAYCSSCTDFQALMPRSGPDTGYDVLPVCAFCMDMLTITASGKGKLRSLPLAQLRSYMKAYDIHAGGAALEKDDLVDAILCSKGPNGCLLATHEAFYRRNSVPKGYNERPRTRSFFSRSTRQETPPPTPQPQQRQYPPPPGPPPLYARAQHPPRQNQQYQQYQQHPRQQYHHETPSPQMPFPQSRPYQHSPPPPQPSRPYPSQTQGSAGGFRPSASQTNFHARPPGPNYTASQPRTRQPPPRPRSAAPAVPTTPAASRPPPPPVPSLDLLLQKSSDEIAHLSISTLKSILFENRVNLSLGVLEKQDLVHKVLALVKDERRDREVKEREEREEEERMEWARREREMEGEERVERERKLREDHRHNNDGPGSDQKVGDESPSAETRPLPSSPPSSSYSGGTQDGGLCVICQDEHANMAIIDCGHLALCKGCSEIVMKTSRECPLCRTRIITEQRLLRIFKS